MPKLLRVARFHPTLKSRCHPFAGSALDPPKRQLRGIQRSRKTQPFLSSPRFGEKSLFSAVLASSGKKAEKREKSTETSRKERVTRSCLTLSKESFSDLTLQLTRNVTFTSFNNKNEKTNKHTLLLTFTTYFKTSIKSIPWGFGVLG